EVDVDDDPLQGTNIVAKGLWNALSVVAVADRGNLLHAPDMYMEKLAVGPDAAGQVDLNAPVEENLKSVARALGKDLDDLVVVILDRPRHTDLIEEVRRSRARNKLIADGDVSAGANRGLLDTGVDLRYGIGGARGGVLP